MFVLASEAKPGFYNDLILNTSFKELLLPASPAQAEGPRETKGTGIHSAK